MSGNEIRFEDGAAYDRMMGVWSRLGGDAFLEWLNPQPGLSWVDVGCGNGAFSDLLLQRCTPSRVTGIDPSEGQLRFARQRHPDNRARFDQGNAMALPYAENSFDQAVMALVVFFVPEPARGVGEMRRVVKPGGAISAYVWDILEPGGFPLEPMQDELRRLGQRPVLPPQAEVSRLPALYSLWVEAGLTEIATRQITVARPFANFEDFWASVEIAANMTPFNSAWSVEEHDAFKERLRARLPGNASGEITLTARANAITGRVPN